MSCVFADRAEIEGPVFADAAIQFFVAERDAGFDGALAGNHAAIDRGRCFSDHAG